MLNGEKILITGPASQVAFPLARALAEKNHVTGLARFSNAGDVEKLEACGIECVKADLAEPVLTGLADDFDYVLHFAVVKSGDFEYDLAANGEGVGRLMFHCRKARAFLHCSSAAVYEYIGQRPALETDALGDNHRVLMPTYSICKIAAETVVRFAAKEIGLPTTIARLSVPYGSNGGWPWFHLMMMKGGQPIPVHSDGPNVFNPIHEDDYIAQIPRLLEIAAVPATVLNWGGESASIEDWCSFLGEITGLEPVLTRTERTLGALPVDLTRLQEMVGRTRVPWRDGIRRMVEARNPELMKA